MPPNVPQMANEPESGVVKPRESDGQFILNKESYPAKALEPPQYQERITGIIH